MSKPLTALELAALASARTQFLQWITDGGRPRKPVNPKLLAEVRSAARAMHRTLAHLQEQTNEVTLNRLTLRMQEAEQVKRPASTYADALLVLFDRALLIDRACERDVRQGRKSDPRTTEWVIRAAVEWQRAGGRPSARHRFGRALIDYRAPGVPRITSATVIERALDQWRAADQRVGGELLAP